MNYKGFKIVPSYLMDIVIKNSLDNESKIAIDYDNELQENFEL